MDKEFSTITLNNETDFYRRNLFSSTTMTVNGATYEIISVNPTADAPTVSDTIKYLRAFPRKCGSNFLTSAR